MGSRAAELLLERIVNHNLEIRQEIIDIELVVRASTAKISQKNVETVAP
jgi:DNA-binding LacI/PurR family transcriptional regulator